MARYERIQIFLSALRAALPVRRTVFRPGNPMPELPGSDSHSACSGQDRPLPTGVGKDMGYLCSVRGCTEAKGFVPSSQNGVGQDSSEALMEDGMNMKSTNHARE